MPKTKPSGIAVAYVPVLHRGYLDFFKLVRLSADKLFVIGPSLIKQLDYLRKDLRAIKPAQMANIIADLNIFDSVSVLESADLKNIDILNTQIAMPDEDISRAIGEMLKSAEPVYKPVFLRWDRRSLDKTSISLPDEAVTQKKSNKTKMNEAFEASNQSSDIWRRVGAVLITKDGKTVGSAANQGQPSSHTPWIEGDPRNIFNQGVGIEISLFIHAEASLIAKAAKNGISLDGATMYSTTFPCPACAKLIAHSGIKHLFYAEGYGVLDGQRVLEEYGVELQRVAVTPIDPDPEVWVPYNKSKN